MKKYVCKREDVCAGVLLIRWDNISDKLVSCKELLDDKFLAFKYKNGRVMVFSDNFGYTKDLIYNTPCGYPIIDLNLDKKIDSQFIIYKYFKLEDILRYYGYNKNLTQYDLDGIVKKIINNKKWLKRNEKLFELDKYSEEGYFSKELYDGLDFISKTDIRPHEEEPNYGLIKRR